MREIIITKEVVKTDTYIIALEEKLKRLTYENRVLKEQNKQMKEALKVLNIVVISDDEFLK